MKELSGDIPLSGGQKIWYLLYNGVHNALGLRYPLRMRFWHAHIDDTSTDSPMRAYLDAFMKIELPKILPPQEISVLDIG